MKDKAGRVIEQDTQKRWQRLKLYFGGRTVSTITIADSRAYAEMRRRVGIKNGTIYTELLNLRVIFNWAKKHNLIAQAPYVELPPPSPPRERSLSETDVKRLLRHVHLPHLRLAIILMLSTAARVTALLELTWDRVDFDRRLIHLSNPHEQGRRKGRAIVPINNSLSEALFEAYQTAQSNFVIEWYGKPIKNLWTGLRTTAKRAGVEGVSPHVFRHTAAVWMAEAGVPMSEISQYLGHSNTIITERVYARYSPDYLKNAATALEVKLS